MSLFSKPGWKRGGILLITAIFVAAALILSGCQKRPAGYSSGGNVPPVATAAGKAGALFDESAVESLYDRSIPAVVQIESVIESPTSQLPGNFFFQVPKQEGQGSGFFVDGQGHILTNYHVVDGASTVTVTTSDGTQYDAKVIGTDRNNDLALLQIDVSKASNIAYLTLGDSGKVRPGQEAIALGSPFGLQGSITVGIVSGIGRSIPGSYSRNITNTIQTDAAINPGNSGGPLLNSAGEVIGINTAIEASANGVGFAEPINLAKSQLPQLLKGGSVKTPWLGIEGTPVDNQLAGKLSLSVSKGVYVIGVLPGSPAEKAALVAAGFDSEKEPKAGGDVITAIDGTPVNKVEDMLSYFNGKQPGDSVTLSVIRGGQTISVPVMLGEWPEQLPTSLLQQPSPDQNGNPDQNQNDNQSQDFQFGPYQFHMQIK